MNLLIWCRIGDFLSFRGRWERKGRDFRDVKQVRNHSRNLAHGSRRQRVGSNWLKIIHVGFHPAL